MKNTLEYKGYHAKIEFDQEDNLLIGTVIGIQDVLCFHGESIDELKKMFHQSIDNYLELCDTIGRVPDKEYKGSFNVRISRELHREAAIRAECDGITLNQFVEKAIKEAVSRTNKGNTYIMEFPPFIKEMINKNSLLNEKESANNYKVTNKSFVI